MAMTFHRRFQPKTMPPDDWREVSLHRAAVRLNRNDDIPAFFPQESLELLFDLAYSLPRRGFLFITSADEFLFELAIHVLPPRDAADVIEIRNREERLWDSVAGRDFDTARALSDRLDELRKRIANMPHYKITEEEIIRALQRDGIDLDS